jgi:GH18 family chitinase
LDLQEIENIISTKGVKPMWDKSAAVKWITWDSNQWISYDDDDTFQQKRTFANSRCLGGTMVRNARYDMKIACADQGDAGLGNRPEGSNDRQRLGCCSVSNFNFL